MACWPFRDLLKVFFLFEGFLMANPSLVPNENLFLLPMLPVFKEIVILVFLLLCILSTVLACSLLSLLKFFTNFTSIGYRSVGQNTYILHSSQQPTKHQHRLCTSEAGLIPKMAFSSSWLVPQPHGLFQYETAQVQACSRKAAYGSWSFSGHHRPITRFATTELQQQTRKA